MRYLSRLVEGWCKGGRVEGWWKGGGRVDDIHWILIQGAARGCFLEPGLFTAFH